MVPRYSFSGADTRVYAFFQGLEAQIVELESFNTISISIHEAKSQARALGYKKPKGTAGSIRTIAGSFIMTVIENHPLKQLTNVLGEYLEKEPAVWSQWSLDRYDNGTGSALNRFDFKNRLSTTLPEFNLIGIYVSEAAKFHEEGLKHYVNGTTSTIPGAAWLLEGVSIINEGLVTSVHDVVSEQQFTYIASDFKPLAEHNFNIKMSGYTNRWTNNDWREKEQQVNNILFGNQLDIGRELYQYKARLNERYTLNNGFDSEDQQPEGPRLK